MRAVQGRNSGSQREKRQINVFGAEALFAPAVLGLLANIKPLEVDQSNIPVPALYVNGIVPSLRAQLRSGEARDAIFKVKQALADHTFKVEMLDDLYAVLSANKINLGLPESITTEEFIQILREYPTQAGTYNMRMRRGEIDDLIIRRQRQLGRGPEHRHWKTWLANNDEARQELLAELMRDVFNGVVDDELYRGVHFPHSTVGVVQYSDVEQYTYPPDFKNLQEDLRPMARVYAAGLKAA
jgi:hypothetical protein